jgi:NAD(P)-dependent dehydrogenase (short-subunit alcohol dehydrogenase family)
MSSLFGLAGRSALVVGGGQGIGRATALFLARLGARVAVLDCERVRAEQVAAEAQTCGVRAVALVADVTRAEEAARGVAEARAGLGALDAVVNIVGSASWGPLLELSDAAWERDFAVNLKHHWYVARAAARGFVEAKQPGALCVVGSVSGNFSAANHGAYGAAKAGLHAFVRSAAEEWWPLGIRVNAVVPGMVRTPRIEAAWASGAVKQPAAEAVARMAAPEDIAHAAVFLVSELARRITGQTVIVDGGQTTRFPFDLS